MAATKRTPEIEAAIIASVRAGAFPKHAAEAAGISKTTLHEWCHATPAFAERIAQAKAQALNEAALIVSGNPDWRARAWWAERIAPDEYGERAKLELTGADGGPVQVATVPLTPDELAAAARSLVKVAP